MLMSALSPSAEWVAEYSQRNKRAAGRHLTDRNDRQTQLRFCYDTSVSLVRLKTTFPLPPRLSLFLSFSICVCHTLHTLTQRNKQTNDTPAIRVGRLQRV